MPGLGMTRIDFYSNAGSKLHAACRIVGRAWKGKHKVLVFTPEEAVARSFDRLLWTYQPIGFVPHCMAQDPLAVETPVLITTKVDTLSHDEVLVNLAPEYPAIFSRFARLIEVVGLDEIDRTAARARWRFYKDRGYAIEHHDLAAQVRS